MDEARFSILQSEIETQIGVIESIYKKIEERMKDMEKSELSLESSAYQLHNLYCAFEDLFRIVANFFENTIENRRSYHIELLRRMSISIEGIRPALLSAEAYKLLDNLRAFRHFFRHAYAYEIDSRKIKIVLEDAFRLRKIYQSLARNFLKSLKSSEK
ncbi:MAG: hypothetical protein J7J46_07230 [Candidatus Desulfofervidus sp.]|nr:hypothetical protein [Candidatus Desulfofervidus sp.]